MSRLAKLSLALIVVGVVVWLLANWLAPWVWHPLGTCTGANCKGYQFWSGIASDFSEITLLIGMATGAVAVRRFLYAHFECHEETCHKLGVHPVKGTPYRTCWADHPVLGEHEKHGVPLHVIHTRHHEANHAQ